MFLTSEEAALELRVTPDTVREWAALGKLPGNKMGRLWRFEKNKVEAFARGEWASTNERPAAPIGFDSALAVKRLIEAPIRSTKRTPKSTNRRLEIVSGGRDS